MNLPGDESAATVVQRRRAAEAARQRRIFNTRNRVMGLDLATLDRQVVERRERDEMEKQHDRAYDALRVSTDESLMEGQKEEEMLRRKLAHDLVQYRASQQRAEDSRDADLNFNHKGVPEIRLSIPESELGPASMQVFQGEDVGERERKRAQMEEADRTLRAQREERETQRRQNKHNELLTGWELVQQDLRAVQLDSMEEQCKRAACVALSNFNQAQAEEQMERSRQERMKKEGVEQLEVWHMVTSDLLTERPEAAKRQGAGSSNAAARVLSDRWKGMSAEQKSAIRRQQETQRAEKERLREMEKQRDLTWDSLRMEQTREQQEEERKEIELGREKRTQLHNFNQQLAREQKAHQQYLDKQLYTNQPTARYFAQFGSSSR